MEIMGVSQVISHSSTAARVPEEAAGVFFRRTRISRSRTGCNETKMRLDSKKKIETSG